MATPVLLTVMDSKRPGLPAELDVEVLSLGRRLARAALRLVIVSGVGAVVMVLPLLHLCGAAGLLLGGPIAAALTFRTSVLTREAQHVSCPKCSAGVKVTPGAGGWPVRMHCEACGSSFDARPV